MLDIGCGSGAASLCLAARVPACRIIGLELQPDLARLAGDNVAANGMAGRITMLAGDLLRPPPGLVPGSFDHVMANPPFLERGRASLSPNAAKAAAAIEGEAGLDDWIRFAVKMVRPEGSITFVHRADRIEALLGLLGGPGWRDRHLPAVARGGTRCRPCSGPRSQTDSGAGASRRRSRAA